MNETITLGQQILDQLYAAFQALALFISLGGAIWYFAAKPFLVWRDQWRAQRAAAAPPPTLTPEPVDGRTNGRTDERTDGRRSNAQKRADDSRSER